MAATISAIGIDIPPMFVFPRKKFKSYMLKNAPVGSLGTANQSGWMTTELFVEYLDHFIKYAKCSQEEPVLLVLDNHVSHVSLAAAEKGIEHGIVMLTLHPHTSHKLQPLDKAVYGPFKQYYDRFLDNWIKSNPGKTCSIYDVAGIAKEAYNLAFCKKNIESAFQATGIFPLNRDVYTDADFLPSDVTDRPKPVTPAAAEEIHVSQDVQADVPVILPEEECDSSFLEVVTRE